MGCQCRRAVEEHGGLKRGQLSEKPSESTSRLSPAEPVIMRAEEKKTSELCVIVVVVQVREKKTSIFTHG
uniref:Uncharacterized protein n=1 Tax=Knipowitschia caucasica TaxID=637954 RepID=A0AAV2LJV1_KNICA